MDLKYYKMLSKQSITHNQWRKNNIELIKLNKIRYKLKKRLIETGLLPESYPYTKCQEELSDKLKSNKFPEIKKVLSVKKHEINEKNRKESDKLKKINRISILLLNKQKKRLTKVIAAGLIPETHDNLKTDLQKEIYDMVMNHMDTPIKEIINTYINHTNLQTKQKYLYDKLRNKIPHPKFKEKGKFMNIRPEDIIINEYCPFLGLKIDYRTFPRNIFVNESHSFDRIVNSRGYVSGNVWIISRLANVMKNEANDKQLKTFCKNILIQYERKINRGI